MRRALYAAFRAELQPIPHIAATLDALPCPFCVASSSQPERIELSLTVTGLWPRFARPRLLRDHGRPRQARPRPLLARRPHASATLPPPAWSSRTARPASWRPRPPACGWWPSPGGAMPRAEEHRARVAALAPRRRHRRHARPARPRPRLTRRCPCRAHGRNLPAGCPSSPPSTSAPPAPAPASSTPPAACSPAPRPRSTSTRHDGHAEQSSAQIWQAAAAALRAARAEAAARPEQIAGLAFDATCSLVLLDARRPPGHRLDRPATTAGTPSSGSTTAPPPRPRNAPPPRHRVARLHRRHHVARRCRSRS